MKSIGPASPWGAMGIPEGALSCFRSTPEGNSGMNTHDLEIDALRRMTPAEKLAVMHALIRQAYELKAAAVRARWPDLSEEEVGARVRALVGGDGS